MKHGECVICEGWIKWNEPYVMYKGKQYCEVCFEELKKGIEEENENS